MLCVRTLSGFLPSLFSSSVVWQKPGAAHKATSAAHSRILFIAVLQSRSTSRRIAAMPTHEHEIAETVCREGMRVKRWSSSFRVEDSEWYLIWLNLLIRRGQVANK